MTEPTIKLKLKQEMIGTTGKPAYQMSRLRNTPKCKEMNDEQYAEYTKDKTLKELLDLTPKDTLGEYLVYILNNCIKLDNNSKAAEVYSYITKINNHKITAKAEWEFTKDELEKFKILVFSAKENMSAVHNGQVANILEVAWAEMITKTNKPAK